MARTLGMFVVGVAVIAITRWAIGDTLRLTDGRVLTGTLVERRDGVVWFRYVKNALPTTDVFAEAEIKELVVDATGGGAASADRPKDAAPATEKKAEPAAAPEAPAAEGAEDAASRREWSLLGRNLSAGFLRAGVAVRRTPNRTELTRLWQQSDDADVKRMARTRLQLELTRDRLMTGRKCLNDFEREMWVEAVGVMRERAPKAIAGGSSVFDAIADPNNLVIGGLNVVGADFCIAREGLLGERDLRSDLRNTLSRRLGDANGLAESDFQWKFRAMKATDDAVIWVSNASKRTLNRVFIVAELQMDEAKTRAAAEEQCRPDPMGEILTELLDARDSLNAAKDVIYLRWEYEAADRGTTTYLDRMEPGQGLTVGLSPLMNLLVAGESARLDVYADEGHASISLPVSQMQEEGWKQIRRGSPPPRRGR